MKSIPGLLALLLIVGIGAGCSGNDKDRATASSGSMPSMPNTAQGAAGAGTASAEEPAQVDPASSGGSTLPASTPYSQQKGTSVSQNVNPAPFLTASQAKPGTQSLSTTGLVSRADGTMFGPADLPAAGIGPGMEGAPQGGTSRTSSGRTSGGGLSAPVKPSSNQTSGK